MRDLIDKVLVLKDELDKKEEIIKIKELNDKINNDKELNKLIEEYRVTRNEEIKDKIISNPLYLEYKHTENEVNFIILKIRSELKKITNKDNGCVKNESN